MFDPLLQTGNEEKNQIGQEILGTKDALLPSDHRSPTPDGCTEETTEFHREKKKLASDRKTNPGAYFIKAGIPSTNE